MTAAKPSVEEVASGLHEFLLTLEGDYSGEGDRWRGVGLAPEIEDALARYILAFAARRERAFLLNAVDELEFALRSRYPRVEETPEMYADICRQAAGFLRRLAAEVAADGE